MALSEIKNIPNKHVLWAIVEFMAIISITSTLITFFDGNIIAYGDAESHLNIAKRIVHSLTPGAAQLGGIWLPIPHLMLMPFVFFEPLWRTGLAGGVVSGICYIVTGVFLYKTIYLLSDSRIGGIVAMLVFALNPNILYLQSTPMTELPLLMFFMLSSYYFIKFIKNHNNLTALSASSFFTFCATLTRYDGWLLALVQAAVIFALFLPGVFQKESRKKLEGYIALFSTLAFFGILLWLMWDFLILGDPLYFTNSQFSAKSQQQGWLKRGELPTYHNLPLSILYYTVTSIRNIGPVISVIAAGGFIFYLLYVVFKKENIWTSLVLMTPFIFYPLTLFLGQSVIFIPELTPASFSYNLFNVRYGVMMVPVAAFFIGYCFAQGKSRIGQSLIAAALIIGIVQSHLPTGPLPISMDDGLNGLSHSLSPGAEQWLADNYDHGNVLLDDYARTVSIIRSGLPMEKVIYVGNKPYWEESLTNPERHADWIVMQEKDMIWTSLFSNQAKQDHLFKYYQKAYTSPTILIFKRNRPITAIPNVAHFATK